MQKKLIYSKDRDESHSVREWAYIKRVNYDTINNLINDGKLIDEILDMDLPPISSKKIKDRTGEESISIYTGDKMKIIDFISTEVMLVEFQNKGKGKVVTSYSHFKEGKVGDPNNVTYAIKTRKWKNSNITNKTNKRIYSIWNGMTKRCYHTNHHAYHNYGGRGIKICKEWKNNFDTFYDWAIKNGYEDNLTIDRIDVNGDYCPENCRWATRKEQANNTRTNVIVEYNGNNYTISQLAELLAEESNIPLKTIRSRLNDEWSIEDIINTPVGSNKKGERKFRGVNYIKDNDGIEHTYIELSNTYGISVSVLKERQHKGLPFDLIIMTNDEINNISEEDKPYYIEIGLIKKQKLYKYKNKKYTLKGLAELAHISDSAMAERLKKYSVKQSVEMEKQKSTPSKEKYQYLLNITKTMDSGEDCTFIEIVDSRKCIVEFCDGTKKQVDIQSFLNGKVIKPIIIEVGDEKQNVYGTVAKVTNIEGNNITIEFQDDFKYTNTISRASYIKGHLVNPYDKTVYGKGFIGVGKYSNYDNGAINECGLLWKNILNNYHITDNSTYNFQKFAKWYYSFSQEWFSDNRISFINCRTYDQSDFNFEECILLPSKLKNTLEKYTIKDDGCLSGICKHTDTTYRVRFKDLNGNRLDFGLVKNIEDGNLLLINKQKSYARELALEYKHKFGLVSDNGCFDDRIYNFLNEYDIEYKF